MRKQSLVFLAALLLPLPALACDLHDQGGFPGFGGWGSRMHFSPAAREPAPAPPELAARPAQPAATTAEPHPPVPRSFQRRTDRPAPDAATSEAEATPSSVEGAVVPAD